MLRRHIIQPGAQARTRLLGTAVTLPLLLAAGMAGTPAMSDVLPGNLLVSTSGDGLIFNDPAEGVLAPGIKSVTFTSTRDPILSDVFLSPYENIIVDYSDAVGDGDLTDDPLENRGSAPNCMMANNPTVFCDSASGSGKRIKTWLTGRNAFDMRIRTSPTYTNQAGEAVDVSSVDYFNFGKVSNFTGARITGLSIELLAADGTPMGSLDPANAVLFNLDPDVIANLGNGARLVDGLFGAGGNEGGIGFFDADRAGFSLVRTDDTLDFGSIADLLGNAFYVDNFGNAFLDNSMVPDGLFWDDNANPSDEAALVAWNNIGAGGWTYGNIALPADVDARLVELAASLGVEVAALGYVPGGLVPADIVAAAEANGLFEVAKIEDLRNANVNYTIRVGTIDGNEFIIRTAPRFAPIVESSGSRAQFVVAGSLDAANVPYLGADAGYLAIIDSVMALAPAERQQALAELGFSAGAGIFGSAYALGTDQFFALPGGEGADAADGSTVSSKGASWSLDGDTRGFVSLGGRVSEADATSNNFGYETESMNAWAGIERNVTPGNWVGVMLGAGEAKTDLALGAGGVDVESMGLGLYARGSMGGNGRYKAMLGWQNLSLDTERNISVLGATATGETDGSVLVAGIEADWLQPRNNWRWGPTASVQFAKVDIDGYAETGAGLGNLTVGDQSTNFLQASAGLRAEADYKVGGGMMHSFAYATITSQTGGDDLISANFAGLPSFSMPVDAMDDTWVDLGVGVSASLAKTATSETTIGAEYKGAFFADGFESHAVRVSLNVNF